ncbi:MAG: CaiB/BaiF CoA-transferase family protein [Deltaproteobacteria bacterium]|nr:CaiB/BaiF CoA-transferase family protein [Deltaproteobacteria bacterium]
MSKPILDGVKVLDLSHMYPGTLCTWLLAALGAEILKVEGPDAVRSGAPYLNQGKRSITLNLKSGAGREIVHSLARQADIVVEGFRPGVARRLRVDYDTFRELNPRLVYCSISSFGQSGPSVAYSAHDINFLALSGMLAIGREAGRRPLPPAAQVADVAGGGYPALTAILAAYIGVLREGEGRYIDISMFDWTLLLVARYLMLEPPPRRSSPEVKREHATLAGTAACYDTYEAADGGFVSLAALGPEQWGVLCKALGLERYTGAAFDPEQTPRIKAAMRRTFKTRPRDDWVALLRDDHGLSVAPVYEPEEVLGDPHVRFRKTLARRKGTGAVEFTPPFWFAGARKPGGKICRVGQHTGAVLKELGYTPGEIRALRKAGAV